MRWRYYKRRRAAYAAAVLKSHDVHTALDTSLFASREALDIVLPYVDLFLIDVKAIDEEVHKACCGVPNKIILENLKYIDAIKKPYEIRVSYIPGENQGQMLKIAEFLKTLSSIDRVKLLAYHDLSRTKYEALGIKYGMVDVKPPREDEYNQVFGIFKKAGLNVIHK